MLEKHKASVVRLGAKGSVKQNQGPTNRNLIYSIGEIIFTNNISGGDIIYKIYFLWLIGKFVYNKKVGKIIYICEII